MSGGTTLVEIIDIYPGDAESTTDHTQSFIALHVLGMFLGMSDMLETEYVYLSIYLSTYLPIDRSIYLSIDLSIYMKIMYIYIYKYIHTCIFPFVETYSTSFNYSEAIPAF